MRCGSCHYTDGCCYTSMPPQVKCVITNKFHYYDETCDCEAALAAREAEAADDYIKYSGDQLVLLDDILNSTPDSVKITAPSFPGITELGRSSITWDDTIVGATSCLVCGEEVPLGFWQSGPKICDNCQKAIKFIKEKFKEELIDV